MKRQFSSDINLKLGAVLGYVNYAVQMVVQLLYVPIMLRLLGQNEYGVYQLVASVISYLSLLQFGFGGSYLRFYSQCKGNREKESELNGTFLLIFCFFALLVALAGTILTINSEWFLGNKLSVAEHRLAKVLFAIMSFNMFITFPNSVFHSIITSRERFIFLRVVDLIKTICNPFLVIILLFLGYGSVGMVLASTLLSILAVGTNVFFVLRKIKAPFAFSRFNLSLVKDIGTFSFFVFLNIIIDQINWNVDRFLLGRFVGAASIAVYSIGMQINNIFVQITDMLATVLAPKVNQIVANDEHPMENLQDLFTRVGRLQAYIVFAVIAGFFVLGREFICLWAGPDYDTAYYVALLLIVPVGIPLCQTLGVDIQRALNKHQARSMIYAGMALMNLLISIPLTRTYGVLGAAFGTTCSILMGNGLIMNILYQKYIGLNIICFWKEILKLLPTVIIPVAGSFFMKGLFDTVTWGSFFVCGVVFVILYGGCLWFFGMNKQEKHTVNWFLSKRKNI